ncbi:MAG: hypothetical protein A2749_01855 [Parcubacteria group bacterium RIFCSPHIGHO2_01_FULL_45_26]|nr:MAG: hypothetical protein A2749_01855 [Parcubacteria group bacterium RIFCSPHIGHO2_01_FULL_45_26]
MAYYIIGLGNPGEEYCGTRHNVGRELAEYLRDKSKISGAKFFIPDEFMNNSGRAVAKIMIGKKTFHLLIIHDDLDLPIGSFKLSFNKGSGGHRGVASIIKALKTEAFMRLRVGICPCTPKGSLRKPVGDDKIVAFILGRFKKPEQKIVLSMRKKIIKALNVLVLEGKEKAMSLQY